MKGGIGYCRRSRITVKLAVNTFGPNSRFLVIMINFPDAMTTDELLSK